MTARPLDLVFIGLSLSSSWGNGHATTYRALLRGLAARGHRLLFLERDVPWYAENRDLPEPDFCTLALYGSIDDLQQRFGERIAAADAVVVGSYVPEGQAVAELVFERAGGIRAFYDIDTPVTVAKLADDSAEYLSPGQIKEFDLYLSFSGGPILDRLRQDYGAKRPVPFYCAVDEARYAPSAQPVQWDLGYLGTYSPDRQPTLERLLIEAARRLPDHRFVVAGPQYPAEIDWPANVERIEHLAPSEHATFYARQRFTLNVTRADMIAAGWSPSVRLFEAAACCTPIISDRWNGLSDLLPENEAILIADDTDQIVRALTELEEAQRQKLAQRARSIVLGAHTGIARAAELERHLAAVGLRRREPGQSDHVGRREAADSSPSRANVSPLEAKMPVKALRASVSNVLVAGGAGFLGSFLCERLIGEGRRVICLDSFRTGTPDNLRPLMREPRFSLLEADVCQPLPESLKVDRIYNLACPASPRHYQADPIHTLMTSVLGARNLLELARANQARLVQASTSEVYGDPDRHPQHESYWGNVNPIGVRACYDEGKRAAEALCFDYMRLHHVDVRVARIFNTYGPRMRPDDGRIVSNLIVQALRGQPLTVYGSGEQTRSFCYVTDLIDGLARLMEIPDNPRSPINIGNSEEYTINQLAQLVSRLTGSSSPIVYEPLPADDPQVRRPDITSAREILGWMPRTSVQEGLMATIAWFSKEEPRTKPRARPIFDRADLALQPSVAVGAAG
jgi:nucleoside-diphosphate-sugar epimerase/spore maturation protein CgeB